MAKKYRADHVGSLLRPQELLDARKDRDDGKITAEQLTEIEDRCILQALELQKQAGMPIFTEGEYRRAGWATAVRAAIEGLVPAETAVTPLLGTWMGPNGELANRSMGFTPAMVVGEKIRQVRRLAGDESSF